MLPTISTRKIKMQTLSLQQITDFLETATIEKTVDFGHALVHAVTAPDGLCFTLMNDLHGETSVSFGL